MYVMYTRISRLTEISCDLARFLGGHYVRNRKRERRTGALKKQRARIRDIEFTYPSILSA